MLDDSGDLGKRGRRKLDTEEEIDILEKTLDRLVQFRQSEERQCEQRITFFLSLASVTVGSLAFLIREPYFDENTIHWIFSVTLFVLFVFGVETLNGLNWRLINIRCYNSLEKQVHMVIDTFSSSVKTLNDFGDRVRSNQESASWILRKVRGGPAEFMYLTNGLIAAGFILTIERWKNCPCDALGRLVWCVVGFVIIIIAEYLVFMYVRNRMMPEDERFLRGR